MKLYKRVIFYGENDRTFSYFRTQAKFILAETLDDDLDKALDAWLKENDLIKGHWEVEG